MAVTDTIARLRQLIDRNLADASAEDVSPEGRYQFVAAAMLHSAEIPLACAERDAEDVLDELATLMDDAPISYLAKVKTKAEIARHTPGAIKEADAESTLLEIEDWVAQVEDWVAENYPDYADSFTNE